MTGDDVNGARYLRGSRPWTHPEEGIMGKIAVFLMGIIIGACFIEFTTPEWRADMGSELKRFASSTVTWAARGIAGGARWVGQRFGDAASGEDAGSPPPAREPGSAGGAAREGILEETAA